jgi:hypothetical protein
MYNIRTYLPFLVILIIAEGCVNHNLEPSLVIDCSGINTVSFASDIQPIINSNCAISGCHNGDLGADIDWTDPVKFKNRAGEASRRVRLPSSHSHHMPRTGEISLDEITLIVCWAEQGASINN